jgi:Putative prokaryotic signal transducing protein
MESRPLGRFQTGDVMAEAGNATTDEQSPDPNEKLVKVFDSEQEPEALVVKGLLDSAGIDSDLRSASLVQDAFPGLGGMIILVREEDADAARGVIAEGLRAAATRSGIDDDTTAEIAIIEDPPQKA